MEKNIIALEGCERELTITMTQDEIQPYYDKAYREVQPLAELKGFRKGKVPMNLIKQHYGRRIEAEAIEDIANEVFAKTMEEEKRKPVGAPNLKDIDRASDKISFSIVYEELPKFDLIDYRSLSVDEPVHTVVEDEIDNEVRNITVKNGDFSDSEVVSDINHFVGIQLMETDEQSGTIVLGKEPETTFILLSEPNVVPELRERFLGKKVGDMFLYRPSQFEQGAPDILYTVKINLIQKLIPADFNNDLVAKISEGRFETTEELREEIGFQLQEQWNDKARQEMENQIVDALVDAHEFPVPKSVIWKTMESMVEDIKQRYKDTPQADKINLQGLAPSIYPMALRIVKWELIRNEIIEKEKLEVEDHDIEEIANYEAERTKQNVESIKKQIMKNDALLDHILAKKAIELLLDFTETNEVPFEDYMRAKEEQQHNHAHHDHDHTHEHEQEHDHHIHILGEDAHEEKHDHHIHLPGESD